MAQNDALTFMVKIMEDPNHGVNALVKQIEGKLNNITINLKGENINISGLESALKKAADNLGQIKVVDENSLQRAITTIGEVGKLLKEVYKDVGKESPFKSLVENVEALKSTLQSIQTTVSNLGATLSASLGASIANNISLIGDAAAKATASLAELNKEAGGGGKKGTGVSDAVNLDVEKASNAQKQIEEAIRNIREEYNKLFEKFSNLKDLQSMMPHMDFSKELADAQARLTSMLEMINKMDVLMAQQGSPERFTQFLSTNDINAYKNGLTSLYRDIKEAEDKAFSSNKAQNYLEDVRRKIAEVKELMQKSQGMDLPIGKLQGTLQELSNIESKLKEIVQTGKTGGLTMKDWLKTGEYSRAMSQVREEAGRAKRDLTAVERQNKANATAEIKRLKDAMNQIKAIQAKTPEIKINGAERAIEDIKRLIRLLEQAKVQGSDISRIQGIMGGYSSQNMGSTVSRLSQEQQAAAHAADQHAQAQQRMEQAISHATSKAQQQSQVLGDLRSMAAQYLSVWGAASFVKEVAQVTGELELQRKSLGVILDSASQAQDLFNQVKTLSQMSPYTFQDMLKSTRQLAAFGVETKDLYGTMKSLSDLGAGLDVDVQRLILAYGHVKSAGVLSGIQRRQFETAGINITGEIAKLYNERYKSAGSDERVTNADIFKKITKREIGFEDVEQAIIRMTSEGGKFYNMQLKQYETLGGKLRNLRNNYNIMLDEVGKSYMNVFAGGVDAMNSMLENWRTWEKLIKSVTAALVAAKVASLALGKSWSAMNAARNTARKMRYEAQALGMPMTPQQRAAMSTNYVQGIVNNNELNRFQKLRAVLRPSVSGDDRWLAVNQITGNVNYADQVKGMKRWQLGFERLKLSAQSFFSTMRAGFASIAMNPMVWIGAAIAGITALTSKASELREMRETATRTAVELSGTNLRDMAKERANLYEEIGSVTKQSGTTSWTIDDRKLDAYGVLNAITQLDEMLQKFDPMYKGHIFDAKMIEDDRERVYALVDDLNAAMNAQQAWKESAAGVFQANTESGYGEDAAWWNLGLKGHWGQWDTAIQEAKEAQAELTKLRGEAVAHSQEIYDILFGDKRPEWQESGEELSSARSYIKEMMDKYHMDFEQALTSYINTGKELRILAPDFTLDTGDFQGKVKSFGEKAGGMIKVLNSELHRMIDKGLDSDALAAYLKESIKGIFSVEGFEVTDPAAYEKLGLKIIEGIQPPPGASKELADKYTKMTNEALSILADNLAEEKISEMIELDMNTGVLNVNMDPAEFAKAMQPKIDAAIKEVASEIDDPRLSALVSAAFTRLFNKVKVDPRPVMTKFDQQWKTVWRKVTDPNDPRFKLRRDFEIIFNASTDTRSFWEELTKEVKRLKEEVQNSIKSFTVLQKVGINLDLVYNTATAKAQLDKLSKAMLRVLHSGNKELFMEMYHEVFEPFEKLVKALDDAEGTGRNLTGDAFEKAQKRHADDARKADAAAAKRQRERDRAAAKRQREQERARNAAEKAKQEQERKAQEAERKEMERIRNRIQQLQDLRKEYKDLRQYYSKDAAMRQIQERYRHDYGEEGVLTATELNAIEDFTEILNKEIASIRGNKKILDEENRKRLIEAARKAQSDLNNIIFKEQSDKMLSDLNSDLQKLLKQYEQARKVIGSTGDMGAASSISGIGGYLLKGGWVDNILESVFDTRLAALLQRYDLDPTKYGIDYKKVTGLDDKGIDEYVKDLLGDEKTSSLVQAVSSWLKEYKRQYDDVGKAAVDAYTKAASGAMDYQSQIMRINSELKEQNDLIDRTEATPSQKEAAKARNDANAEMKRLEVGNDYKRFFDGIFAEPLSEMSTMAEKIEGVYADAMAKGAITAEDYAKKIMEVNDVMEKAKDEASKGWFEKGIFNTKSQEEITKEMLDAAQNKLSEGADLIQRGNALGGEGLQKEAQVEIDEANARIRRLKAIQKAIAGVDRVIQAMNKAFNYIYEAFDALGEGDAIAGLKDYIETLSNVSGHVNNAMGAFMRGDPFEMAAEGAGSVMSLITGLAQAHDNRLQRKIEDIQRDTAKMSNTLETIRALRERTLGYDTGALRRQMEAAYNSGDTGKAADAMREYYSRHSLGSGYEQELQLLTEQRDKIIEMYNLEASKKKKNKEELEDYKRQIADLDQQLMFFTEDLANELWGIDLKGWADQLGDALMTAFENGTSAASAFKDTVQDIMRGVVKNMLTVGIIEPALEKLRVRLFGTNGEGGLFNSDNPKGSMGAVLSELGNWFENEGPALMDAANEFYNGADNMMRQTLGYGMRSNESSTSTTNSISATASEETMGIVAGYLSRLSQDVSVQRIMQEMFVNGSWPDYIEKVTSANDSLSAIDRNTLAVMEMMRDGNGALYERVENMSRRLDNFANGIDTITMR